MWEGMDARTQATRTCSRRFLRRAPKVQNKAQPTCLNLLQQPAFGERDRVAAADDKVIE